MYCQLTINDLGRCRQTWCPAFALPSLAKPWRRAIELRSRNMVSQTFSYDHLIPRTRGLLGMTWRC